MNEFETQAIRTEMFDGCVNPLANIICNFLAFQVSKGTISRDEAKYIIASSVDVINTSDVQAEIKELGADMLMRMVTAIDTMKLSED